MTILKKGRPKEKSKTPAKNLSDEMVHGKDMVKFSMNVPRELHEKFRTKAFMRHEMMKDILHEAIRKYLKE